jgi:hypothetical protein
LEQLIHYLIENRYVDNETSAEKILSVISDEFYSELVESATEELSRLNAEMRKIMQNGGDLTKIAAQIKAAKEASAEEYKERGKPREQEAPRTISGGKGPQTPKSGPRGQRDSREGYRDFDAEQGADKLVGRMKSAHLTSTTPIGMQRSKQSYVSTGDPRSTRRGVTGDRKLRAGAIENENRFDRSR